MPVAPDLRGSALDGRYELHELIGEGTFGRVYRGRDRRLARAVAIKVIKPWWAEDPAWVADFEREAQLLARVSHPGIVQIFDIGHGADGLYYVSELVEGHSLATRLIDGPLTAKEAIAIAHQLCQALEHAHRRGIVHRDVKPANILLAAGDSITLGDPAAAGAVKLGDFGVARLAAGSSDDATVAGTPRYMAPEQARGRAASPPCDIYSVGVVLYEMLAGRPPFHGGSAVDLALRHLTESPPALTGCAVPPALERVVMRALAKAPQERFASAAEMGGALLAAASAAEMGRAPADAAGAGETRRALPAAASTAPTQPVAGHPLRTAHQLKTVRMRPATEPMASAPRPQRTPPRSRSPLPTLAGALLGTFACLGAAAALAAAVLAGSRGVAVPRLIGKSASQAAAQLRGEGLRARLIAVPAPGARPGSVVSQRPAAGRGVPADATVAVSVAQAPRWRYLTSLGGSGAAAARVALLGRRLRLEYSLRYTQSCTFLLFSFCSGPTVSVIDLAGGATVARFALRAGSGIVHQIAAGPGDYELQVSPGATAAEWRITVYGYY